MGAWIEIKEMGESIYAEMKVAPLVGAWIEIPNIVYQRKNIKVAPLVGAWIEILEQIAEDLHISSLLSWERGLK